VAYWQRITQARSRQGRQRSAAGSGPGGQQLLGGMLVEPGHFEELFDGALRDDLASSEDKKLVVFVSTGEADSVCATRILQVRVSLGLGIVAAGALLSKRADAGCCCNMHAVHSIPVLLREAVHMHTYCSGHLMADLVRHGATDGMPGAQRLLHDLPGVELHRDAGHRTS
jgi:hypothetical protein